MPANKYICDDCSKSFTAKSSLTRHISAVHRAKKPHKCSVCSRAFASKSNLQRHSSTVHRHERSHACAECPMKLSSKGGLQKHVSAVHLRERPHTCECCHRSFALMTTLRQHARHCQQKNPIGKRFACGTCSRCFPLKSDLDLHRLNSGCPQADGDSSEQSASGDSSKPSHGDDSSEIPEDESLSNKENQLDRRVKSRDSSQDAATDGVVATTRTRDSESTIRCPRVLDVCDANVFFACENLLYDKLVHSTSVDACANIMDSQCFLGSVPEGDEKYDGFEIWNVPRTSELRRRVHFELRPESDGLLFPFSLYPKKLPIGSTIKTLSVDANFLTQPKYALFYVASTPTQFGADYLTTYQTHIVVATTTGDGGSFVEQLSLNAGFKRLDKHSNCVLHFSSSSNEHVQVKFATKVKVDGRVFHNRIVVSFLGDFCFSGETNVEISDATKVNFSKAQLCPFRGCARTCSSMATLKVHYRAVHSNLRMFSCTTCKQKFKSEETLASHMITHQQPDLQCARCSKSFKTKRALLTHIEVAHRSAQLVHKCSECNASFKWKSRLKRHILGVHRGERKHVCDCGKRFSQKSDLTKHVAIVHQKQSLRIHSCTECGRGFASNGDLTRHASAVHRSETPHMCLLCGRRFSLKGNLVRHVATVHRDKP